MTVTFSRTFLDHIIHDAHLEIIVPADQTLADVDNLTTCKPRQTAFFDELLQFYLLFKPSESALGSGKPVGELFPELIRYLDIQVSAAFTDYQASGSAAAGGASSTQPGGNVTVTGKGTVSGTTPSGVASSPQQSAAQPETLVSRLLASTTMSPRSPRPSVTTSTVVPAAPIRTPMMPMPPPPAANLSMAGRNDKNVHIYSPVLRNRPGAALLAGESGRSSTSGRATPSTGSASTGSSTPVAPLIKSRSTSLRGSDGASGLGSPERLSRANTRNSFDVVGDASRREQAVGSGVGGVAAVLKTQQQPSGANLPLREEEIICSYTYHASGRNHQPVFGSDYCLFPLRIPIDLSRSRDAKGSPSQLILQVNITQKTNIPPELTGGPLCDIDDFDAVNLFEGLADDPYFNPESFPVHRLQHQYRRQTVSTVPPIQRLVNKTLSIQNILNVKVIGASTNLASSSALMSREEGSTLVSVHVENTLTDDVVFEIESVQAELHNAVLTPMGDFEDEDGDATILRPGEELVLLFDVNLLDDPTTPYSAAVTASLDLNGNRSGLSSRTVSNASLSSSLEGAIIAGGAAILNTSTKRLMCVTVRGRPKPGRTKTSGATLPEGRVLTSKWYCRLDLSEAKLAMRQETTAHHGRTFYDSMLRRRMLGGDGGELMGVGEGIYVSFSVSSPVFLRKIFSVQVVVVNRSQRVRRLTISVPAKYRSPFATSDDAELMDPVRVHLAQEEFMQRYIDAERREASIVCLENNLDLRL
ncbi:hypothetical protein HK102_009438 [Quaeritorhiza haematococci]|nr:hypothetical protein HK102_009438 [Quaeritorhiza haematococci]